MAQYVNTCCRPGSSTKCWCEVRSQFVILYFRQTQNGSQSRASKWFPLALHVTSNEFSEISINIVNRHDMEEVKILRDHPKPVKHLTYDPSGSYLAASCTDGNVYVYNVAQDIATVERVIDGIIRRLETDVDATSECVWHPDGRAFACVNNTRDIVVVSIADAAQQKRFTGGHMGDITSMSWSTNGALLASSSADDKLVIWETKTQQILKTFNYEKILHVTWHPHGKNLFNWTNSWGETFIIPDFLRDPNHVRILQGPKQRAPFYHDPLDESGAAAGGRKTITDSTAKYRRAATPDSLDELLGPPEDGDDNWIEDDDGAGYTNGFNGVHGVNGNGNGKRTNVHLNGLNGHTDKRGRPDAWEPQIHPSFQPGATSWRGNRRYLCLNTFGTVWTVDQDTHNTVTVSFEDKSYKDFHFTDPFQYDKAWVNDQGTLFSCPPRGDQSSMLFYRPHEMWTNRTDWRVQLPEGEEVTTIALSRKHIVCTTSANYVRAYTLYGTPYRIWRHKSASIVTSVAHEDTIMTIGNGAVGSDGCTQLTYTIEDIRREEVFQSEDLVALVSSDDAHLKNVFFSNSGDPCIFDSSGVLLILTHWRTPGQAKWIPVLDTKRMSRTASGRIQEKYWAVGVGEEKFSCIILKGQDHEPHHPRPHTEEFDFEIPISHLPSQPPNVEETPERALLKLEEMFLRQSILLGLLEDLIGSTENAPQKQRIEANAKELSIDKTLLQLLAVECRDGEERGMKALELVSLMKDRGGKMLEAATKIANRYGRTQLEERIQEVGERRIMGMDNE